MSTEPNSPEPEILWKLEHGAGDDAKSNDALVKVAGLDLRGRDLRHAELSQAKLYKVDLRGAKTQDIRLNDGLLQGADLSDARSQGANLIHAQLQGANLSHARLQGADLFDAWLQGANLRDAQLQGANLRNARLQGADLSYAQLQGANLSGARLQGADLNGARLQGADLGSAELQGADLRGAQLQGINFQSATLGSAVFDGAASGHNDFRQTDFNPLTQQDFDAIAHSSGDDWEKYLGSLRDRIGQPTKPPQSGFEPPCLADADNAVIQNCGKPEAYFPKLAGVLGNLACQPGAAESQRFIATGIAWWVTDETEWKNGGESARQQLARRLLADDCAGKEGIEDWMRAKLKAIAEPPKPAPASP